MIVNILLANGVSFDFEEPDRPPYPSHSGVRDGPNQHGYFGRARSNALEAAEFIPPLFRL
jgi:hypothetical protein